MQETNLMENKKKPVLVSQGHYSFFTATGIYYINHLSEEYLVDLIVPKEYKDEPEFFECLKRIKVNEIYYLEDSIYFKKTETIISKFLTYLNFFNFSAHLRTKKLSADIMKNTYEAYFSHDYMEMEHIYLFDMFRKYNKNSPIISIISSQPSNENTIPGFKQIKSENAKKISLGIPIIHQIIILAFYSLRYFQSFFQNIFYPMLASQIVPSYLPLSAFNNIDIVPRKGFFDLYVVYEEIEKEFYDSLFNGRVKVERVNHPINCNQNQLMSDLYGEENKNNISIFFSTLGIIPEYLEKEVDTWIALLHELVSLDEDFKISAKFHPRMNPYIINYTSEKIIENFENKIDIFTGTSKTAEEIIFNSQIVIGDTSSTLIWAQYFEDKKVFSLSLPGFINNTDMKRYHKINVTSDPKNIIRIIKDKQSYISEMNTTDKRALSLNDLMRKKIN